MAERLSKSRGGLAALWAIYMLPRLAVCLLDVAPTSDAQWYYARATGLAAGHGYLSIHGQPTAYWPPGWPMALGLVFALVGPGLAGVKALNLLACVLIGWLVLDLGRRLFDREAAGRLGLLLLALYPNAIFYVPLALTEVFYTALLLLGCWLLLPRKSWLWLAAAGLVFGLASLVKAQTMLCAPLVLSIDLLRRQESWNAVWQRLPGTLARLVLVLCCAACVVAPWSLRNARMLGAPVAISTNGGITLLTGNCDTCNGGFSGHDKTVDALNARGLDEVAYDIEARRLGMAWIMAHPMRFLALMPVKLLKLWVPDGEAVWAYETGWSAYADHAALLHAMRAFNQLWYWSLLGGAAWAFVLARRQARAQRANWLDWWLLPYAMTAYVSAIVMVFSGQTRFHYPAMPLLCLACGWLIDQWLSHRRPGPAPAFLAEPSRT
jgi:4-amino-4-deoxy-L-arabinose transferase-like glycosyltransferase